MDQADIPSLLSRLQSDEDAMRKMAVFKLQSSINDPSFADVFISSGGLDILRRLIMNTGGNTLAYSLQSLSRLLDVDMGWDIFEANDAGELVERVVELIVTHPLVNILRGAMSILVAVVNRSQSSRGPIQIPGAFGFRALEHAVAVYPQFFEMVVSQLHSADHALCANALMLLNSLMRDAISNDGFAKENSGKASGAVEEWPKFIKKLQDLGVIKAAYNLMQSSSLQDLAYPLLEFQALSKVLLSKWRDMKIDLDKSEHRRALKGIHLASAPDKKEAHMSGNRVDEAPEIVRKSSRRHNPEKWRRLGFETESPVSELDSTGFLGLMDLVHYVSKNEDGFQKLILEQASRPRNERCPIARASLSVTEILYEHFEVDKSDVEDAKNCPVLDEIQNNDKIFRPLLLQWSRLHTASLQSFFRLWKQTGAEQDDFERVAELLRILVEQVVGQAPRTIDIIEIEEELAEFDYGRLRELQMEILELSFEDQWGQHLNQVRDELRNEALQFVKEQRIRAILQGAWFPQNTTTKTSVDERNSRGGTSAAAWRFVKLSPNRRFLHYADYDTQPIKDPPLDDLDEKIDLGTISSVVSNVSSTNDEESIVSSSATATTATPKTGSQVQKKSSTTRITINSFVPLSDDKSDASKQETVEKAILTLMPLTNSLASEWLDGLLMLLNQAPMTAETSKLVSLVSEYGLKIRLFNMRVDGFLGPPEGAGVVPSREGLDNDYYYEV